MTVMTLLQYGRGDDGVGSGVACGADGGASASDEGDYEYGDIDEQHEESEEEGSGDSGREG